MMSNDFEKSFSDFLETHAYDQASELLFALIRNAYLAGWKAAGGTPPTEAPIFTVLPKPEENR